MPNFEKSSSDGKTVFIDFQLYKITKKEYNRFGQYNRKEIYAKEIK